jgi:SAM-dependent methyltransferase
MRPDLTRRPHASLDAKSRIKKARKIEQLLSSVCNFSGARILEVGTGSGFIAEYFATLAGPEGRVHAVDLIDQRKTTTGFVFTLVSDTTLPFDDDSFDICISNHVLEHVGDSPAQGHHLREIKRILRPDGWLYLAVPNRWTLVEPHFRLPFLSWLPRSLADTYVRISGRGPGYDCDPPSHGKIESILANEGYTTQEVSFEGIRIMAELELPPGIRRRFLMNSGSWPKPFHAFLPSFLYLAQPS